MALVVQLWQAQELIGKMANLEKQIRTLPLLGEYRAEKHKYIELLAKIKQMSASGGEDSENTIRQLANLRLQSKQSHKLLLLLQSEGKAQIADLEAEIANHKEELQLIRSGVDQSTWRRFEFLIDKKRRAIVKLRDQICQGCGIVIDRALFEKANSSYDHLVFCQHCDRIVMW